jgi:hypothetical protein
LSGSAGLGGVAAVADGSGYCVGYADAGEAVTSVTPGTAATPANMSLQDIPPATPGKKSAASNAPTHDPNSPENKNKTHYIEIKLVDNAGNPSAR